MDLPYGSGMMTMGSVLHQTGRGPMGQSLAAQVTARISRTIMADTMVSYRKRTKAADACAKYEGPQQLDFAAGDFVFEEKTTKGMPANDDNVFSVFNGLPKEAGLPEYQKRYRFVGIALDQFPISAGSLAPMGIDLQIAGICNWVNGWTRTVNPGELITWIPDVPDVVDQVFGGKPAAAKVPRTSGPKPNKVRLVPLDEVMSDFVEALIKNDKDNKIVTDYAAVVKGMDDVAGMKASWKFFEQYLPMYRDRAIGINLTATKEGSYGQLQLL